MCVICRCYPISMQVSSAGACRAPLCARQLAEHPSETPTLFSVDILGRPPSLVFLPVFVLSFRLSPRPYFLGSLILRAVLARHHLHTYGQPGMARLPARKQGK